MDLLILNICETSVTTFLAHSWKESSGLSVNRAELDRTGQRISPGTLTGLSVKRCCWFLWLKLGTVTPREARGILPGAANGSLSAFVLKGLNSIYPASTSLLAVPHGIFAPFLSNSFFFSSCVLISDRLPARVAECGVSNHVSHRGVTNEFT